MKQKTLLLFLLMLLCVSVQGQEQRRAGRQIMHVDEFLATLHQGGAMAKTSAPSRAHVESLMKEVQPSVYLSSGTVTHNDANPVNLYTDVQSLPQISAATPGAASVEFVTVKVKSAGDLSGGINLAPLASLQQLRYVYILSEVNTPSSTLVQSIQNANGNFQVFYNSMLIN